MPPLMLPETFAAPGGRVRAVLHRPDVPALLLPGGGVGALRGAPHRDRRGPRRRVVGGRGWPWHISAFHRFFSRARLGPWTRSGGWSSGWRCAGCRPTRAAGRRWSTTRWPASAGRPSRWARCTTTRCCPRCARRSPASGTCGSCSRCGCRCPSGRAAAAKGVALPAAVPALRRQPAREPEGRGRRAAPGRRAGGAQGPGSARSSGPRPARATGRPRRRSRRPSSGRPSRSWPGRASPWWRGGRRRSRPGGRSTSWATRPTPTARRWKGGRPTSRSSAGCAWTRRSFTPPPPRRPGPARAPPHPRRAPAHAAGPGGGAHARRHVAPPAARPLRQDGHAARLPRHRAVVRRPPRRARPLRRRARPQRPAARRGVLLHRPDGQRAPSS